MTSILRQEFIKGDEYTKESLREQILMNYQSNLRVHSAADVLQINFDSAHRAKEIMTVLNKIRLILAREMISLGQH